MLGLGLGVRRGLSLYGRGFIRGSRLSGLDNRFGLDFLLDGERRGDVHGQLTLERAGPFLELLHGLADLGLGERLPLSEILGLLSSAAPPRELPARLLQDRRFPL